LFSKTPAKPSTNNKPLKEPNQQRRQTTTLVLTFAVVFCPQQQNHNNHCSFVFLLICCPLFVVIVVHPAVLLLHGHWNSPGKAQSGGIRAHTASGSCGIQTLSLGFFSLKRQTCGKQRGIFRFSF
jgi:hypothetical protein